MTSGNRYPSESEEEVLAETLRSLEELIKEVDRPAVDRAPGAGNGAPGAPADEAGGDDQPVIEHRLPPQKAAPAAAERAEHEPVIEHRLPPRPRSEILTDGRRDRARHRQGEPQQPRQRGLLELELPPAEPLESHYEPVDPRETPAADVSTITIGDTGPRPAFDDAPPGADAEVSGTEAPTDVPAADDDDFPVLEQVAVLPTHRTPGTAARKRQRSGSEDRPVVSPSTLSQLTDTTIARLTTEIRRATGHELDQHARSHMRKMLRSALNEWAERLARRIKDGRPPVD
jgi:hypothetical protein